MSLFRTSFLTGIVLQLLTGPIHLIGHLSGPSPPASEDQKLLLELMSGVKEDFGGGFVRSTMDIFLGLSLQYSIFVVMVGLANLLAFRMAKETSYLRALCWLNAAFMGILAVNAFVYFFIPPLLLFVLPALAFLIAALAASRLV
jgi:hypothetical protein